MKWNDTVSIIIFHLFQVKFSLNKMILLDVFKMYQDVFLVLMVSAFRFAKVEDQKDALRLYTVQIPHKRERKPLPCYLTKWDGKSFLPLLTKPCGNEVISCLSVRWGLSEFSYSFHYLLLLLLQCSDVLATDCGPFSDSGTFLGLGTVTGSVSIYIAFSLQVITHAEQLITRNH